MFQEYFDTLRQYWTNGCTDAVPSHASPYKNSQRRTYSEQWIKRSAVALITLLTVVASRAEEINLRCKAHSGGSCQLYIDTDQKYLTYCQDEYEDGATSEADGKQYVRVEDRRIRFGDQSTTNTLDRYTGILTIEKKCIGSNKGSFVCAATGLGGLRYDPISCAKETKAF